MLTRIRLATFVGTVLLASGLTVASDTAVTVTIKDPSGASITGASVEIYNVNSTANQPAKPLFVATSDDKGGVRFNLPSGSYLVAVKKVQVTGALDKKFDLDAYPLVSYFKTSGGTKSIELQTLKLSIRDAKIVPTDIFLQYYGEEEKGKKARLDEAPGNSGRVIKLIGAPVATLELKFPKNTVGIRGMGTYTPTSFEFPDDKHTLLVRTYMYDGKVKNAHNIVMMGTDLLPDNGNRLMIENIQEKSGAEVPFEPKASILSEGIVTSFKSNITFVSDETTKPAKLLFHYFYLDDPEHTFKLETFISPDLIK